VSPQPEASSPPYEKRLKILLWIQLALVAVCTIVLVFAATTGVQKIRRNQELETTNADLEKQIDTKRKEMDKLEAEFATKKEQVENVRKAIAETPASATEQDVSMKDLADHVDQYVKTKTKIDAVLQPRPPSSRMTADEIRRDLKVNLNRTPTGQKAANGNPFYDVRFWITSSPKALESVDAVRYYFNHPSFVPKTKVGSSAPNGFEIRYRGWGCIDEVGVTVVLKGTGEDVTLPPFRFCDKWGVQP